VLKAKKKEIGCQENGSQNISVRPTISLFQVNLVGHFLVYVLNLSTYLDIRESLWTHLYNLSITLSIKFRDRVSKKIPLEHIFPGIDEYLLKPIY
jgi:hypothetical protein